ncbi:hypothetical protein [Candidatus Uabimicrobium amorphum]|uniref:Uncharacterized protein n=1 Tax=Uabimicrobium amorphum TaxID=2596890 RepID=A0A5S9F7X5_UABAM|nr:hypothetical protein [Candidatus Uabimicrobium amorphum]BBM87702.1 hypothetical protein UABAM_06117 [Candidatus Uabimicrobium amorphum]
MKIKQHDGWWEFSEKEKILAQYHYQQKHLYKVVDSFVWACEKDVSGGAQLVTSVADIYAEESLDFAEEYLLLHGEDEKTFFWEA